jgi:methylmalonyl-CoA/ethylmalonyl-CoA epimerase
VTIETGRDTDQTTERTLPRIDHIGIVVDDLDEGKRFLRAAFGLAVDEELDVRAELGAKAAFFRCANVTIELLELVDDDQRRERLGDASARIEHVCFAVDDVTSSAAELSDRGVEWTTTDPIAVAGRAMMYTRPESSDGVIYQILQRLA